MAEAAVMHDRPGEALGIPSGGVHASPRRRPHPSQHHTLSIVQCTTSGSSVHLHRRKVGVGLFEAMKHFYQECARPLELSHRRRRLGLRQHGRSVLNRLGNSAQHHWRAGLFDTKGRCCPLRAHSLLLSRSNHALPRMRVAPLQRASPSSSQHPCQAPAYQRHSYQRSYSRRKTPERQAQ